MYFVFTGLSTTWWHYLLAFLRETWFAVWSWQEMLVWTVFFLSDSWVCGCLVKRSSHDCFRSEIPDCAVYASYNHKPEAGRTTKVTAPFLFFFAVSKFAGEGGRPSCDEYNRPTIRRERTVVQATWSVLRLPSCASFDVIPRVLISLLLALPKNMPA